MSTESLSITINGISPLLMHRFPLMPIDGLDKMRMEDQAEHAAYRDEDTRQLFVPCEALQRCFINAATYSKGKRSASLQKPAAACLIVSPVQLFIFNNKKPIDEYSIDSRRVVIKATSGSIVRHRPRIDDWSVSFELDYDTLLLSIDQVREIVDNGGRRIGVLDFRPEKKGPYGRFMVTRWE